MCVPIASLVTPVQVVVTMPLPALPVDLPMGAIRPVPPVVLATCVPLLPPALRYSVLLVP